MPQSRPPRIDRRRLVLDGELSDIVNARDPRVEFTFELQMSDTSASILVLRAAYARARQRDRREGLSISLGLAPRARAAPPLRERWGAGVTLLSKRAFPTGSFRRPAAARGRRPTPRAALEGRIRFDIPPDRFCAFGDAAVRAKIPSPSGIRSLRASGSMHRQLSERTSSSTLSSSSTIDRDPRLPRSLDHASRRFRGLICAGHVRAAVSRAPDSTINCPAV